MALSPLNLVGTETTESLSRGAGAAAAAAWNGEYVAFFDPDSERRGAAKQALEHTTLSQAPVQVHIHCTREN